MKESPQSCNEQNLHVLCYLCMDATYVAHLLTIIHCTFDIVNVLFLDEPEDTVGDSTMEELLLKQLEMAMQGVPGM